MDDPTFKDYYDDSEADPMVDENTLLYCVNTECLSFGESWHPETYFEYQGEHPHGGMVEVYKDDAFSCLACLHEGSEDSPYGE